MILMAVLAPVMIMAVLVAGAATIAVAVISVAVVGGVVVGASERAFYAVARRRAARKREVPDNVVAWPRPTARREVADPVARDAGPVAIEGRPRQSSIQREPVPVSSAAGAVDHDDYGDGFAPWEEVFPFDEPDFEEVVTYTLVAGSDF
jgi:hypothetical protein